MTLIVDPLVALVGLAFGLVATLFAIRQRVPSSRRRLRPWPGRGGIPGKGDGRALLASLGGHATGQVTRPPGAGPTRKPPQGGSALPTCEATLRGGMWSGSARQLADWVMDRQIELSSVDPCVRPDVEAVCVCRLQRTLADPPLGLSRPDEPPIPVESAICGRVVK